MAAISNTVQGLNETVGLLKQILKVVSGDGKKNVDVKDVTASSNVLNSIDEKGTKNIGVIVSSLEPLDKMKDVDNKAKNLSEAIKILSSKEVIEGLKKYNSLSSKVIYNISSIFVSLADVFDNISDRFNISDIESFVRMVKELTKAIDIMTNVMYKLAGFVIVCVVVGFVAILAWKQILIGFGAIVGIALGVVAISWMLKMTSKITENMKEDITFIVLAMTAISLMIIVALSIGFVAILAWKQILIGFGAIAGVAIGIVAISWLLMLTAELTKNTKDSVLDVVVVMLAMNTLVIVSTVVGLLATFASNYILLGFQTIVQIVVALVGVITIMGLLMNKFNIKQYFVEGLGINQMMPTEIKNVLTVLASLTLIPIVCVLVGYFALEYIDYILAGFATFTVIALGIVGLLKAISWATKDTKKAIVQIKSLIITIVAMASLVYGIIKLAQFINESQIPFWDILTVVGLISGVMFGFNMLIKIISKIKVTPKEILVIGTIIALMTLTIFAVKKIIDLSKEVNGIGWGNVFITLASISGAMLAFGVFIAAIGGMMMIPFAPIVFASGAATILTISGLAIMVGSAIKKIVDVYNDCVKSGIKIEEVANIGKKMGDALSGFVKSIYDGMKDLNFWSMTKIGIMMKPIKNIINTCSKFLKMISSFTTEDCSINELRTIIYDEKTGEFKIGHKINVSAVGTSISSGFASFVKGMYDGMKDLNFWSMTKIGIMMKPIKNIINTCSKFLKMITSFTDGEDGVLYPIKYIERTNEKGEVVGEYVKGEPIHLTSVAGKIANSFTDFCVILVTKLKGIKGNEIDKINDLSESGIGKIIGACSTFVEMISSIAGSNADSLNFYITDKEGNYLKDDNGNYKTRSVNVKKVGAIIASGFTSFVNSIDIDGKAVKKKITKLNESGLNKLLTTVSDYSNIISSYSTTNGKLSMLLRDKDGNYVMTEDGKYKTRIIDMPSIGLMIKNGFQGFIDNVTGIDSKGDLSVFAKNFESITNSFDKITDSIIKVTDSAAEKMKKNTEAINKFAEAVNKVCDSIDRLNEMPDKDLSINVNTNNTNKNDNNTSNRSDNNESVIYNSIMMNANNNAMAIKQGIMDAFKSIHFELSFDNNDRNSGEIIPVPRGSDIGQSNSYAWE